MGGGSDFLNLQGNRDLSEYHFWNKVLEYQAKRRFGAAVSGTRRAAGSLKMIKRCTTTRLLMKRRARVQYRRRMPAAGSETERKVRILKRLVPNCESMALDSLFRETADYILALQMRLKVMQVMVRVLSGSE